VLHRFFFFFLYMNSAREIWLRYSKINYNICPVVFLNNIIVFKKKNCIKKKRKKNLNLNC
jgi:hypothetical protein